MSLYLGSEKVENVTAQITLPVEPSDDLPLADGTASAGISKKFSRADHVHPMETVEATLVDIPTPDLSNYVKLNTDKSTSQVSTQGTMVFDLLDKDNNITNCIVMSPDELLIGAQGDASSSGSTAGSYGFNVQEGLRLRIDDTTTTGNTLTRIDMSPQDILLQTDSSYNKDTNIKLARISDNNFESAINLYAPNASTPGVIDINYNFNDEKYKISLEYGEGIILGYGDPSEPHYVHTKFANGVQFIEQPLIDFGATRLENIGDGIDNGDAVSVKQLKAIQPTARKVTLTTSGWSNNQQTVTCTGVSASATNQEIRVMPADATKTSAYVSCGVSCVAQAANKLTFACDKVPTTAIDVYVVMQSLNFQS